MQDWTEMEKNGAIFLPNAGARSFGTYYTEIQYNAKYPYYWSSDGYTYYESNTLDRISASYFSYSTTYCASGSKYDISGAGYSVRLVKDL